MSAVSRSDESSERRSSFAASRHWLLLVILAVGFALRLGLAAATGLNDAPEPGTDQQEYDAYAWNLATGHGFRGMSPDVVDKNHLTAYRPPGPSVLFASVYLVFGHRYDAVRVVNCILSTLSILFVYRIGKRTFGEATGLLAAAGYAIYPLALLQSADLISEPLGVLLFLGFLDAGLAFAAISTWKGAALAGVLFGLSLLTRANYVLMIPLVVLWAVWQFWGNYRRMAKGLAVLVVAGAVMTPWIVRNYLLFGKVIPFSSAGGSALLQGNNRLVVTDEKLFGYSVWDTLIPEYREALQSAGDELERDDRAKKFAVEWLRNNKDKWGFLLWHKFTRSWTPWLGNNPSAAHRLIYLLSWGPILVLFCAGVIPTLISMLRNGQPGWLLHLAVLHYVFNSLIFFANIRYRAPVDPICILIAAWTAVHIWDWVSSRGDVRSPMTKPVEGMALAVTLYAVPATIVSQPNAR